MSAPREQTLESLIARYRRSAGDVSLARANVELEVRFRDVDYFIFETVLRALVAGEILADAGVIVKTVNSIMEENPATRRARHRTDDQAEKASLIREVTFDAGKKTDRYYRKWALGPPFRVRSPHTLAYSVVLSAEEDLPGSFTSDAGAVIRAKCRASFTLGAEGAPPWRVDLTVTRTISGADARTALPAIVKTMFGGAMTPASMLELLGLEAPDSELRGLYRYEIELEHLPGSPAGRDAVRPSEVAALVDQVLRLANPEYLREAVYQAEIYHVAGFVVRAAGLLRRFEHEWGLKNLTPQVTALTRADYKTIYPPTGYFLLDKADGIRALASVRDGRLLLLADKLGEFYAPGFSAEEKAARGTPEAQNPRVISPTIVDGEVVTSGGAPRFYAFDVVALAGENVSGDGYEARVACLAEATAILREFGLDARPKPVAHLTASDPGALRAQFQSQVFEERPYRTDGRILVEPGKPYRDTVSYKWKGLWDTTIDFLARRAPSTVLGRRPFVDTPGHELHFLFVGIDPGLFGALGLEWVPGYQELFGGAGQLNTGSYFPIQFVPSDAPLAYLYQHPVEPPRRDPNANDDEPPSGWVREIDHKVVELRCAAGPEGPCLAAGALGAPDWQLVRVREDRARELKTRQYFGNNFRTAELTWLNYVDPFEESQLWEGPDLGYFAAPKSAIYKAQTAFTSFVKSRRIEGDLAHIAWAVDLGIGKGQDYGRYLKAGIRSLVGVDRDQGGLSELVRRKYSSALKQRPENRGSMTLYALCADLNAPHDETAAKVRSIAGFPPAGADAVVSNLAVHYFAGTAVDLRNFAALCRDLVRVGGLVILTTMFGHKVHELLAGEGVKTGQSWDARQEGMLKYSIRRDYAEEKATDAGQRIGVLLPFSGGDFYEEFLVNVGFLTDEFVSRGFRVVGLPTFDSYFPDFKTRNPAMYKMLTPADLTYLGLYGEVVLRREKE